MIFKNGEPFAPTNGDTIFLGSSDNLFYFYQDLRSTDSTDVYVFELKDLHYASIEKEYSDFPVKFYHGLKEGSYSLKVTANKSNTSRTISEFIIVAEDFSAEKIWFAVKIAFYLLILLCGTISLIVFSNLRNKKKLALLRNDWTNKLHNDIGGDLSSVSLRLENLERKIEALDPSLKKNMGKIFEVLRGIEKKLRFVFNLVDPKKDSLQVMLEEVTKFATENYAIQNINFDYNNEVGNANMDRIDIGRVNKLYLAIKEVINNSVKHSQGTQATMLVRQNRKGLVIELSDNGKGFDYVDPPKGNGLNNLKAYAQQGLMDVKIESQIGAGTSIRIFVPYL